MRNRCWHTSLGSLLTAIASLAPLHIKPANMRISVEYKTLPQDQQAELEQAIETADQAHADPKTGLIRLVVGALIYIGRLFITPGGRRFVVEGCERRASVPSDTKPTKKAGKKPTKQAVKVKKTGLITLRAKK